VLLVLTSFETFQELRRLAGLDERGVTATPQASARSLLAGQGIGASRARGGAGAPAASPRSVRLEALPGPGGSSRLGTRARDGS
jgi:hypothetical protein